MTQQQGYEAVIAYWFGELTDEMADAQHHQLWFAGGEQADADIKEKFGLIHQQLAKGVLKHWQNHDLGRLASIIVLDQFSRNLYRGTAQAFAYDEQALALAKEAVAQGVDLRLPLDYRLFMYLPFEHAEDIKEQEHCLALFQGLLEDAKTAQGQKQAQGYLTFAEQHYDIVRQFGRFPHRNEALGRSSRQIELRYLAGEHNRFGQ
ncbi:DUF924 family protein [Motilimonas eburnea]|uniref:DUF924 family protein n=1 Tax=Motilimonas eburnea TaxID=1737488 RepID=UPI001E5FCE8A|nr:DUF924 family protein [Motilimonas eburnea]MCE2570349.1 DUF924 domain-containing protein [Motilimonas eburnea]